MLFNLLPIIFILGIMLVALEEHVKVNKAAVALLMSISMWMILALTGSGVPELVNSDLFVRFIDHNPGLAGESVAMQMRHFITDRAVVYFLGNTSQTLFFVMASMAVVEIVDRHAGFQFICTRLRMRNKRVLLAAVCGISFFFSMLLDNLAAAIVLISILRKLIRERDDRLIFSCMVIIACNAGGSCSPIGDVTTILLWVGGNLSPLHQLSTLLLPALTNVFVAYSLCCLLFLRDKQPLAPLAVDDVAADATAVSDFSRMVIFVLGILSLVMVPFLQTLFGMPPFMGVLLGLSVLWVYTDLMYSRLNKVPESKKMRITELLSHLDLSTILFFLGVLLSVSALETSGHLGMMSAWLDANIGVPYLISFVVGVLSSVVDNVALVAGTIGMYPLQQAGESLTAIQQFFVADGGFWTFLAYCGVTGGSIFIIGSATGVTVMGMEKVSFMYYTKRFTLLALAGYCAGAAVYMLMA